jgi:hypothetical protein
MAMSRPDYPERAGYHVTGRHTLPLQAERVQGLRR